MGVVRSPSWDLSEHFELGGQFSILTMAAEGTMLGWVGLSGRGGGEVEGRRKDACWAVLGGAARGSAWQRSPALGGIGSPQQQNMRHQLSNKTCGTNATQILGSQAECPALLESPSWA